MARGNVGNEEQHRKAGEASAASQDMHETGRKGGEATAEKYGEEFYSEIGKMGAEAQPREAKQEGGRNSHKND